MLPIIPPRTPESRARPRYRIVDRAALADALGELPRLADAHREWVRSHCA